MIVIIELIIMLIFIIVGVGYLIIEYNYKRKCESNWGQFGTRYIRRYGVMEWDKKRRMIDSEKFK